MQRVKKIDKKDKRRDELREIKLAKSVYFTVDELNNITLKLKELKPETNFSKFAHDTIIKAIQKIKKI